MSKFGTVVAAVDFSETSYAALRLAAHVAHDAGGKLHVLHVVPDPWQQPMLVAVPGTPFEELRRASVDAAGERLHKMREECAADLDEVTVAVRMGSPAAEIARYAHEHDATLIVLGTHGQGPVRRFLLGSVADRVIRDAIVPVLTVPHPTLRQVRPDEAAEVGFDAGTAE